MITVQIHYDTARDEFICQDKFPEAGSFSAVCDVPLMMFDPDDLDGWLAEDWTGLLTVKFCDLTTTLIPAVRIIHPDKIVELIFYRDWCRHV
jgi:hypothetical protein